MGEAKRHILVVDDDPDFVWSHQVALESAGYAVDTAATGNEALQRLIEGGIDLVVLDVMLDHPTEGFEVGFAMRHDPRMRDVPILLVSSVEIDGRKVFDPADLNCLTRCAFVRKPVPPGELVRRVRQLLADEAA